MNQTVYTIMYLTLLVLAGLGFYQVFKDLFR